MQPHNQIIGQLQMNHCQTPLMLNLIVNAPKADRSPFMFAVGCLTCASYCIGWCGCYSFGLTNTAHCSRSPVFCSAARHSFKLALEKPNTRERRGGRNWILARQDSMVMICITELDERGDPDWQWWNKLPTCHTRYFAVQHEWGCSATQHKFEMPSRRW